MEAAKQADKIVKEALKRLTDGRDIANFEKVPEIFNNASGMLNGNKINEALLSVWMVSQATNIVFLLWRRQIEHADVEKELRELPSTDSLLDTYNALIAEDKKIADDIEAKRREYMDTQRDLDIFKAVLNGQSKEQAEGQYKQYQERLAQSMKG